MITGILAAHYGDDFFDNVALDLQAIADMPLQETTDNGGAFLPQVHALNCLKDIFTSTRFGKWTEPYIEDSLDIAACCLDSTMYVFYHRWLIMTDSFFLAGRSATQASCF